MSRALLICAKKRKVYEPSLVILNNPRLIYNNEEKTCQSNENPEAEQKEAKEKAHWFSAKVAVSKCPATKPNEYHEESH